MSGKPKQMSPVAYSPLGEALAAIVDTVGGMPTFQPMIGYARSTIYRWLTGEDCPSVEAAEMLAALWPKLREPLQQAGAFEPRVKRRVWESRRPQTRAQAKAKRAAARKRATTRTRALTREERLVRIRNRHMNMLRNETRTAARLECRLPMPVTRDGDYVDRISDIGAAACYVAPSTEGV